MVSPTAMASANRHTQPELSQWKKRDVLKQLDRSK